MRRVLVNIISEQTIPNYLFTKEMIQPGDELLFISSQKFCDRIDWIENTLEYSNCKTERIIFPLRGEEKWKDMEDLLYSKLSKDCQYVVNLTGGTKYMSLLVQHVFEKYTSSFYYIPFPQNVILEPSKNDFKKLDYRLTIKEYLSNYNVTFSEKQVTKDEAYCDYIYERFINGSLNFDVIDKLRAYRNKKKIAISSIETCISTDKQPRIEGLADFIETINFSLKDLDFLNRSEIEFLTGGWFEEYIYYKIKRFINPQDIKLGVLIKRTENTNQNDLDIVFTFGNKLFVVECKTGILGTKMFNETVYKATAIKEAVLGLSANTFIVSLATNDEALKITAKNMGITYICRDDIEEQSRFEEFMNQIRIKAKD